MKLLDLSGNTVHVVDNLVPYAIEELGFTRLVGGGSVIFPEPPPAPTGGFLDIEAVEAMVDDVFWSSYDEDLAAATEEINTARDSAIAEIRTYGEDLESITAQVYADHIATQAEASGWLDRVRDFASDQIEALTDFSYNPLIESVLDIGADALDLASQVDDRWAEFRNDVGEFQEDVILSGFSSLADIVLNSDVDLKEGLSDLMQIGYGGVMEGILSLEDILPDQVQAILGSLVPSLDNLTSKVGQALDFSPDAFSEGLQGAFASANDIISSFIQSHPLGAEAMNPEGS